MIEIKDAKMSYREHFKYRGDYGCNGNVEIKKGDENILSVFLRNRVIVEKQFSQLFIDNELWMSDVHSQYMDHKEFIHIAHGNVLIGGLGLGCCLNAILTKSTVESVTVIEANKSVIELVKPAYKNNKKVVIINDDVFNWMPKNEYFDVVWMDVWKDKCLDNFYEMSLLINKFSYYSKYQMCWSMEEIMSPNSCY